MRASLGVVSACAALAAVLAAAPAHAGSGAPPGAAGPRGLVSRPRAGAPDGRAGLLLRKLENPKAKAAEDLAPDAFLYCGDSLRKPASMALRGGGAEKLSIVFISAEVAPWSVTGGLGAVCDGLPRALATAGHRVMSIAPRYDQYYDAWDTEFTCEVPLGEATTTVRFFHAFKKGVDRVFVDHPLFLERVWGLTKQKLYGPKWGKDWEDNQLRFAMFCRAAMAAVERLPLGGSPYGRKVMLCANDWQGRFPMDASASARLGVEEDLLNQMRVTQTLKVGKSSGEANPAMPCVNMLLGAVRTAGMVLTVSPRYAREVMSDPLKGCELETALKQVTVHGILNGVEDVVRPDNAVLGLTETYDADSLDKKKQVKAAMQSSLGLMVDPDTPVFLFMGRLDVQKGVDIMFEAIGRALDAGLKAQFITMGSGLEPLEEKATSLEDRFPGNFRAILSFKGAEKYRTFAAADFALMPSRYEPCGLVQMEGMRFGTLPIVAPTGGLSDTVFDMQTGIVMPKEVQQDSVVTEGDVSMLLDAISKACNLFRDEPTYRRMQRAAMGAAAAFSWSNSAKEYIAKFQSMW